MLLFCKIMSLPNAYVGMFAKATWLWSCLCHSWLKIALGLVSWRHKTWQPSPKVTRSLQWSKTRLEDPSWAWGEQVHEMRYFFSSTLWHCWGWATEGASCLKKLGVGLLALTVWLKLQGLRAPVVTSTSIILSFNKIHNGVTPVPAYQGYPGKWQ